MDTLVSECSGMCFGGTTGSANAFPCVKSQ